MTNRTLGQPLELAGAVGTIIAIGNEVELDPGVPGHVSWSQLEQTYEVEFDTLGPRDGVWEDWLVLEVS